MTERTPYYLKKIRDEFTSRTERRSDYSLRAFARFLGVEAASLSSVLKGTRGLPRTKAEAVVAKLGLSPAEKQLFLKSHEERRKSKNGRLAKESAETMTRFELSEESHFRIIAEWEHYAILSLIETADFKAESKWIALRLGVSELRVRVCIANLLEAGLIISDGETIKATHAHLATTEDVPSQAIRKARKQDLDLAMNAIDEIAVHLRDLSSCTMTMNTEDLQEFKEMIREFRKSVMKKAESKTGTEVYKLAIQLYPLTKNGAGK